MQANNSGITAAALRSYFEYSPLTGVFFKRMRSGGKKMMGSIKTDGYVKIFFGGRQCSAHRLAWLYVYGKWPEHVIDHINGDRCDNRIANLRDVPAATNSQNRTCATKTKTTSSHVGVFFYKNCKTKPWTAQIVTNGRNVYLGRFNTEEEAALAYQAAKRPQAQPGGLPKSQG